MTPIEFYCPRWGSENIAWNSFFKQVKEAGFDGIEYGIAFTTPEAELEEVWNGAVKAGLKIIAQHYDTIDADFSRHYEMYCRWMEKMSPYPVAKINSQTGKDYFSFEQNRKLIEAAAVASHMVVHETHRNKFSFAAHVAKEYLEKIENLKITLDASHWVCVAESYLEDQESAMQLAIERTDHIHARVGYTEGPQIPDPRVNEWQYALNKHIAWWDKVVARKINANEPITITPEFGPYPYMVYNPTTNTPLASQWDVNLFMMNLLKNRYDRHKLGLPENEKQELG